MARAPKQPEILTDLGQKHWADTIAELRKLPRYSAIPRDLIALYCNAKGQYTEASRKIDQYGPVIKDPDGGIKHSPYLAVADRAHAQMVTLMRQFAGRAAVAADPAAEAEASSVKAARARDAEEVAKSERFAAIPAPPRLVSSR